MYILKIQAAVAAATILLAQNVQARSFHVNKKSRERSVPYANRIMVAKAEAHHSCFSSRANRPFSSGFYFSSRPTAALAFASVSSWRLSWRTPPASAAQRRQTGRLRRGAGADLSRRSGITRLLSMRASGGGGEKEESVRNRVLGTVVYLLPMLDGLEFGRDVFHAVPMLGNLVHGVLSPALAIWDNVPFMPVVMFIILQVSVRRQGTSRFVRFNVQQAILVDILTVVLGLLGTAAGYIMPEGEQFMTNFAFYCMVGAVAYAVAETSRGRKANQIPLISAAAEIQLGPS